MISILPILRSRPDLTSNRTVLRWHTANFSSTLPQYRERTGNDGTGADRPQLICCHSAHAAFAKACEFFDVELVRYRELGTQK